MQRQESINAPHRAQEWQQRWLGPDNDLLGHRLDERCIADELDGIPQAVVTAHQDPLARQWCAIPDVLPMTWPVPARHASAGPQHRIADGPRRLERTTPHVRHPAGCTMLTELIVHGLARFSTPILSRCSATCMAQRHQAYPKVGASGSRPLLARGSATAAWRHIVVGAAAKSHWHSAVPSGRRSLQILRYAVVGWYSAASRRRIPG